MSLPEYQSGHPGDDKTKFFKKMIGNSEKFIYICNIFNLFTNRRITFPKVGNPLSTKRTP